MSPQSVYICLRHSHHVTLINAVFLMWCTPIVSQYRQAVQKLKAERIGHGYHLLEDPELYHLLLQQQIHFEVRSQSLGFMAHNSRGG